MMPSYPQLLEAKHFYSDSGKKPLFQSHFQCEFSKLWFMISTPGEASRKLQIVSLNRYGKKKMDISKNMVDKYKKYTFLNPII